MVATCRQKLSQARIQVFFKNILTSIAAGILSQRKMEVLPDERQQVIVNICEDVIQ